MVHFTSTWASLLVLAGSSAASGCWRDAKCTGPLEPAFPGPWQNNVFSPGSRVVEPKKVLDINHNFVSDWPAKNASQPITLKGDQSLYIFDFGQEVGGVVELDLKVSGSGRMGIAFSEAANWTGYVSDNSDAYNDPKALDGALFTDSWQDDPVPVGFGYTMPYNKQRGGFRYMSLYLDASTSGGDIQAIFEDIKLTLSFEPTWPNLQAYQGYFDSDQDLLNKIWYAGAYTVQTNMISSVALRRGIPNGWQEDETVQGLDNAEYPTAFVDGAKRDRDIWSGDLGLAARSVLVSTGETIGVKAGFLVLFQLQKPTGELPFAGPPIYIFGSDTYHMAILIGLHDYILYTGDMDFLSSHWDQYNLAVKFMTDKIDDTGMAYITGTNAWGRTAECSGHTTDGNMFLYGTLTTASELANFMGDSDLSSQYASMAESLKKAVNEHNFDEAKGAYINSDIGDLLYPQDGNSLALYFNGTSDSDRAEKVSEYLTTLWTGIGSSNPELPDNIVPYIEGYEVKGHFAIGQTDRAIELINQSWGWYLNNPLGTQSTIIEGYKTDGSFKYRGDASVGAYLFEGSFTSHSHGWSTGPTDALTSFVVGLTPTGPAGKTWHMAPHFPTGMKRAQAGFTTPLGKFSAKWQFCGESISVTTVAPEGTQGSVDVPEGMVPSNGAKVMLDAGKQAVAIEGTGSEQSIAFRPANSKRAPGRGPRA